MSIKNPSQYQCDNMQQGDILFVQHRSPFYKWYRKNYQKDKTIIYARKYFDSDNKVPYYQEDCTLFFSWEIWSRYVEKEKVPYNIGIKDILLKKVKTLNKLQVGIENISIELQSGVTLLLPTNSIRHAISKMDELRTNIDIERQVKESLRFARYNGEFFKRKSAELNLREWNISYCPVCGKPIKIKFKKGEPYLKNACVCGNMLVKDNKLQWNDVAYWFNRQLPGITLNRYKEYWKI